MAKKKFSPREFVDLLPEEVNAILGGARTLRRKVVPMKGLQRTWLTEEHVASVTHGYITEPNPENGTDWGWSMRHPGGSPIGWIESPFGGPSSVVSVRESWRTEERSDLTDGIRYRADFEFVPIENSKEAANRWVEAHAKGLPGTWRAWATMPQWACRLRLKITDLRIERRADGTGWDWEVAFEVVMKKEDSMASDKFERLSKERLHEIDSKERGRPQAYEINQLMNHIRAQEDEIAQLKREQESLTFARLRERNVTRCEKHYHPVDQWSPNDWLGAVTGEVGELASVLKNIRRKQTEVGPNGHGIPFTTLIGIAHEAADVVIYLDLLCERLGIDLGKAVVEKFNLVSIERLGAGPLLGPLPPTCGSCEYAKPIEGSGTKSDCRHPDGCGEVRNNAAPPADCPRRPWS
jgi:NTP pyrophosphatase (non-canonical NTP hydrolase)